MPKAKTRRGVQVTCTLLPTCGSGSPCLAHRTGPRWTEVERDSTYTLTVSMFSVREGINLQATIDVEGVEPTLWFIEAIKKNGGTIHGVMRRVDSPGHVDVSRKFGIKDS
jgi:hypothetical protein